jgi:membrane protease YdiL (CAAX protease family)
MVSGACVAAMAAALLLMPGHRDAWTVLLLVAIAPLLEETVFRAGLQESLLRRGMHPLATNLLCAAAFGLLHGMTRSWLLAAWVIPPALLLGAVYARKRSLGLVVALHAAMNFVWLSAGPSWTGLFIPTSS